MKIVIVEQFGGPEVLQVCERPDPVPGRGEVRVRLTSVGINHADLMARRGDYKLYSGEPPFTPGLEGAGVIDQVGEDVPQSRIGQFVVLDARAPRRQGGMQRPVEGTYRTHYVVPAELALPAPPGLPRAPAGTLWLSHLTAWGCLIWKQQLQAGQVVGIPAASSSVGLAASQVGRQAGARTLGLTRTEAKAQALRTLPEAQFDWVIATHDDNGQLRPWYRDVARVTDGAGVDVFFDPVAAGPYLDYEIRCLARGGTIWLYGLLERPGVVDVTPVIRKRASLRGWVLGELLENAQATEAGQHEVLNLAAQGIFLQKIAGAFALEQVREAHATMEKAEHIGKFVLIPNKD
ncbi:MAG: zinc-dependent alcohol dehydrogenase family protein [Candidatus Sumerlaeaceae bacterium]